MDVKIYTIPQAARYCSLSRGTLWKYARSGELRTSLTPGGQYRILARDLESFMRQHGMYPLAAYQPETSRILIVDDDPQFCNLLSLLLEKKGYDIETAEDGFQAGIKVKEYHPELMILDLFLPGTNGFEVCRQVKENPELSAMKILIITGFDTEENKKNIMAAGADAYLSKPVNKELLYKTIEQLLSTKTIRNGGGHE